MQNVMFFFEVYRILHAVFIAIYNEFFDPDSDIKELIKRQNALTKEINELNR